MSLFFLIKKKQTEQSHQANVIAAEGDARAADLIGKALDEAGDGKFSNIFYYPVLLCFNIHVRFDRTSTN